MANSTIISQVLTAASASANGPDLDNIGRVGALVFIDITAITGTTPTLTVKLQGKDRISGKYYDIITSTALNATGTTVLRVYPGLTASANATVSDVLPLDYRTVATIGGTTPAVTATISVCMVGT